MRAMPPGRDQEACRRWHAGEGSAALSSCRPGTLSIHGPLRTRLGPHNYQNDQREGHHQSGPTMVHRGDVPTSDVLRQRSVSSRRKTTHSTCCEP